MTSSTVVKDSSGPRRSGPRGVARSVAHRTIRSLALVLAFVLVVALGINLDGPPPPGPPPLSLTEQAQVIAEVSATDLAAAATILSDGAAADGQGVGEAYAVTAGLLQEQAAALRHPVLSMVSSPTVSSGTVSAAPQPSAEVARGEGLASTGGSSAAATQPAPTPTSFVADLFSAAQQNLEASIATEPGIARLLASVAVSQRHQALALAGLQGLEAPEWEPLPAAGPGPLPKCAGTDPVDPPEAEPLSAAVSAEHQAAYAYEVAAARIPDGAHLTERAEQHALAAVAGEGVLQGLACTQLPTQIPAFTLDAGFLDDPAGTLDQLNAELVGMYADLVGLTEGPARSWAVERFIDVAGQQQTISDTPEAFPGISE
ncbi:MULTISPECIES: DUF4439 domain-containing protein [unclassified Arthrobacter]|uniref:DUF4439 domain-containing protein n=1 Tax=unclassified Arthrobacter TaxID=235627 RepID=UPI00149311DE|nr:MULTISPECIES: DUF4439 domain-containing protein [unclassified Arthrobacter]MBE0009277.1 DUF4439 domain-containing protein [Arthrobacter sp. AET 35A]NOJ63112.1 DUF4439 domain-containing protein [Arthrobacter sp. 147(2020)]